MSSEANSGKISDEAKPVELEGYEIKKRAFTGKTALLITAVAVIATLFHIYALGIVATSTTIIRATHLMFGFILIILVYPGFKKHISKVQVYDIILVIIGISVSIYVMLEDRYLFMRAGVAPTREDLFFGAWAIILILEITRRVIGWPLVIVTLLFILYAKFASYFPGILMGRSFSLERIISFVFSTEGIYGIPIGVSSTFVLLFILFGAFLRNSGAGDFYTNFATAIAGGVRGGAAKIAVVSSALFGTISGSGIANVVTTGAITIPLMKRTGFKGYYAGAVEAVASTGGQIMPPIMGAGAFLMAEMINVPYSKIMVAAIIPALLYFLAVFFAINFQAGKERLHGLKPEELPSLKKVVFSEGHLIIPLIVLVYMLLAGATPIRAAFFSIITIVIVSFIKKVTRMGWKKISKSLEDGFMGSLEVIAACACAGIIMALVTLTGIGLTLSTLVVDLSGGNLLIALLLTAMVVIVLSMGLPTTACYLISATIMAPALIEIAITPMQAHLFIFYFACLSGITPPVALVAYPAAALAKANPMTVSLLAFRLGLVGFLVPFMFVYSPTLLLEGSLFAVLLDIVTALTGVFILAVALEGWFRGRINNVSRIMFFLGGVALMIPGFEAPVAGILLLVIAFVINKVYARTSQGANL